MAINEHRALMSEHQQQRENEEAMVQLYDDGHTLREIANLFKISHETVRQITIRHGVSYQEDIKNKSRIRKQNQFCKVAGCANIIGKHGALSYCRHHYYYYITYGDAMYLDTKEVLNKGICLQEGCHEKMTDWNGLCRTHAPNYYYHLKQGNVADLEDFLLLQRAKVLMGETRPLHKNIRKFIADNNVQ